MKLISAASSRNAMPEMVATDGPRTPTRREIREWKLSEVQHISQANFPPKPPSVKPLPLLRPLVGALCTDCRSHYAANRSALVCPAAAASADHSRRLDLAEADCTERYFTLLRCGDKRLLFSRIEHFPPSTPANSEPEPVWQYVVRQGPGRDDYPMGHVPWTTLQIAINSSLGLAANAALLCAPDERTLVAYGGEGRDGDSSSGARRTTAYLRVEDHYMWWLKAQPLTWARPELAVPAKPQDTGCIDERGRSFCEFDGKNSVVRRPAIALATPPSKPVRNARLRLRQTRYDGRTLLFARSNLKGQGGRHVQLAASADGLSRWSRFRQLRIAGVASGSSATNIYYFNVRKVRVTRRQPATAPLRCTRLTFLAPAGARRAVSAAARNLPGGAAAGRQRRRLRERQRRRRIVGDTGAAADVARSAQLAHVRPPRRHQGQRRRRRDGGQGDDRAQRRGAN